MSVSDARLDAAVAEWRRSANEYTMADIRQGPGEGNYDRIERLRMERAIEASQGRKCAYGSSDPKAGVCGHDGCPFHSTSTVEMVAFDEDDTLVMQVPEERKPMDRYTALRHAVAAHGPETDWCGKLYIFHPMEVARRIDAHWRDLTGGYPRWDREKLNVGMSAEDAVVVALLHDVLEDTEYPLSMYAVDFTDRQWEALLLVTHDPEERTYREYIEQIAAAAEDGRPLAALVKLADLSHNMSDERKENLTPDKLAKAERMTKQRYAPARGRLWTAIGTEWWPA